MPKAPRADSSRKPPLPSESHDDIDDWMRRVMPDLHPVVERLDELIRRTLPQPQQFAVKWKKAYYGTPSLGWVIEVVAYDVSVNIVFHSGTQLDPPPPLGTTGRTRYVKLTSREDVERPELRSWIEQAGRVPGWT